MSSTAGFSDGISKQHRYAIGSWSCYCNTFLIRNYSIIAVRLCLSHNTHSISVISLSKQKQNVHSDETVKNILTNVIFLFFIKHSILHQLLLCMEIRHSLF